MRKRSINNIMPKVKVKCTCGNEFERYIHGNMTYDHPFDMMCPDCNKKDGWRFATRMVQLEKFRCVKCGWKLKEKDCTEINEHELWFKCKCCGYRFALYIPEPTYESPY